MYYWKYTNFSIYNGSKNNNWCKCSHARKISCLLLNICYYFSNSHRVIKYLLRFSDYFYLSLLFSGNRLDKEIENRKFYGKLMTSFTYCITTKYIFEISILYHPPLVIGWRAAHQRNYSSERTCCNGLNEFNLFRIG